MIGIAWKVEEGESFKDAVQQAAFVHKEKFGCWPDRILVDSTKGFTMEGLTVVSSPFVGKAYTFLLYHNGGKERYG